MVEFIRTLDKRYWDKEPKKWFLPIQSLSKFTEKCNELGYKIDSSDVKPNLPTNTKKECKAFLTYEGKKFLLKFSKYVNKFEELRNIDNSVSYHKETQSFTFSREKLQEILAFLHKENIIIDMI